MDVMKASDLVCLWVKQEFSDYKFSCSNIKTTSIKHKQFFSKSDLEDTITTVVMILVNGSSVVIYINGLDVATFVYTKSKKSMIIGRINETNLVNPESMVKLKEIIVSTVTLLKRSKNG